MERFNYSNDRETINAARARALESLLIEKGVITSDTVDKIMAIFETEMGPFNGAKLVARAWVDPEFKKLLGEDTMAAVEKMNFVTKGAGAEGEHMRAAINTPEVMRTIVIDGAMQEGGMASFRGKVSPEELESIRAYLIDRANQAKAALAAGATRP